MRSGCVIAAFYQPSAHANRKTSPAHGSRTVRGKCNYSTMPRETFWTIPRDIAYLITYVITYSYAWSVNVKMCLEMQLRTHRPRDATQNAITRIMHRKCIKIALKLL